MLDTLYMRTNFVGCILHRCPLPDNFPEALVIVCMKIIASSSFSPQGTYSYGIWDMGILFNLGKPLAQGLLPKAPSNQYKDKKSNKDTETKHNQNPHKSN